MKTPNFKAKSKVLSVAILLTMLALVPFIALEMPTAKASNETISISVNDGITTNFAVYHCVTGYHVNDYYSTAAIAVSFDTEQTGFLTWAHVHLIRVVKFYHASGSVIISGERAALSRKMVKNGFNSFFAFLGLIWAALAYVR